MWKVIALFIGTFLPKIVYRVLAAMGIAAFSLVGINQASSYLYSQIDGLTSSGSSTIISLLGITGLDHYITLLISAYVSVFVYKSTFKVLGVK